MFVLWAFHFGGKMTQTITNNEINEIASSLYRKSKRTFKSRGKSLIKQAQYITPAYRDFVLKIIKNSSLKIVHHYQQGATYTDLGGDGEMLSKRAKNYVTTDITDKDTLPHELGHAVDFMFGRNSGLSSNVIIKNNKTLFDIFNEEFERNHESIYNHVMNEYKTIINSNIHEGSFYIIKNNIVKYELLCDLPINNRTCAKRLVIQKELYDSGFVEAYYQLVTKKCFSILNTKYSPILDALSSKYDIGFFWLDHHSRDYYFASKTRAVEEFFANVFAAKITSKQAYFDSLLQFLPKSFSAFESLFVLVYDHIQNNKRFTDLILKGDVDNGL